MSIRYTDSIPRESASLPTPSIETNQIRIQSTNPVVQSSLLSQRSISNAIAEPPNPERDLCAEARKQLVAGGVLGVGSFLLFVPGLFNGFVLIVSLTGVLLGYLVMRDANRKRQQSCPAPKQ